MLQAALGTRAPPTPSSARRRRSTPPTWSRLCRSRAQPCRGTSWRLQTPSSAKQDPSELRRLGFVLHHSSKAIGYLAYLYNQARTHVPEKLRPQLDAGEQFASKHGQPLVNKLADRGQEMLRVADGQVRTAFASI